MKAAAECVTHCVCEYKWLAASLPAAKRGTLPGGRVHNPCMCVHAEARKQRQWQRSPQCPFNSQCSQRPVRYPTSDAWLPLVPSASSAAFAALPLKRHPLHPSSGRVPSPATLVACNSWTDLWPLEGLIKDSRGSLGARALSKMGRNGQLTVQLPMASRLRRPEGRLGEGGWRWSGTGCGQEMRKLAGFSADRWYHDTDGGLCVSMSPFLSSRGTDDRGRRMGDASRQPSSRMRIRIPPGSRRLLSPQRHIWLRPVFTSTVDAGDVQRTGGRTSVKWFTAHDGAEGTSPGTRARHLLEG